MPACLLLCPQCGASWRVTVRLQRPLGARGMASGMAVGTEVYTIIPHQTTYIYKYSIRQYHQMSVNYLNCKQASKQV